MPENEKPPAMRVDIYLLEKVFVEMHIDLLSLNIYIVFFDIMRR